MTTPPRARKFRIRRVDPRPVPSAAATAVEAETIPASGPQPHAEPAPQPEQPQNHPQNDGERSSPLGDLVARFRPAGTSSRTEAPEDLPQLPQTDPAARSRPEAASSETAGDPLPDIDALIDSREETSSRRKRRAEARKAIQNDQPVLDDGFGEGKFPTAKGGSVLAPNERTPEEEIATIRTEGLTGRQLRMARRVAQKHGIEATSDFEAVRLLRRRGIDPFQRSNMLDLVMSEPDKVQLPQTVRQDKEAKQVPSTEVMTPERRASEILQIQRDIARRRRRKLALLATRLAFFVVLPTLITAWYYFMVATPLYATNSQFVIQQADSQASSMQSLFSGTQFATSQDSITVQGYLQSREAMQRLDRDLGFRAHWSQASIDPIQRLSPNATEEEAYRTYKRNVKIGYDPTEGIIKMEVIAADPAVSAAFSQALLGYAEEQVDQLTQRLREDQMRGARDSYQDAETKVQAAQQKVLSLQEQLGVLDPAAENSVAMSQISTFQVQLGQKRLELQQLLDNPSPNQARVTGTRGDIKRLEALISQLRASLTSSTAGSTSLASVSGQLRIAEAELETRQTMLSQAAQQMETARIEANKQVRYLSTGVRPLAPDEATYPRAGENTLVALLIFSGLYLMISLTASILREQVSA